MNKGDREVLKAQSLKTNFFYQSIYQVLILVIPLITAPYLTRTLDSTSLGIYSYANSIAYYFVLFINMGILQHGQRIIAVRRDDEINLRRAFWTLYLIHFVLFLIVGTAYIIYCFFIVSEDQAVYLIQSLYVLSALADVTWLFYGLENFKNVVIKNALVKIIECVAIFIFVKSPEDLLIYTFIMSGSVLLGQAIMLPQAIRIVKPIKVEFCDCKEHIKPMLILFVSVVAATLYTVFDKTLLGILSTIENVAYYEYSNKIINIPKSLLNVIGMVLLPRACKSFADGDVNQQIKYVDFSMFLTFLLGSAFSFGLAAISAKFAVLYLGFDFSECGNIIKAMSPLIIIILVGNVVRTQYLIPAKKDFLYVVGIVISAILNLIISIALIPKYHTIGAVTGTTIAELFGTVFQMICSRSVLTKNRLLKYSIPFLLLGELMYIIVSLIDLSTPTNIASLVIEIFTGGIIYCVGALLIIVLFFQDYKALLLRSIYRKKAC